MQGLTLELHTIFLVTPLVT